MPRGWTRQQSKGAKDAWGWLKKNYPAIARHLDPYAIAGEKRYDKGDYWWELRACDYYAEFEKAKIIYPNVSQRGAFVLDNQGTFIDKTCYFIPQEDKYLLGLLNSRLLLFYFSHIAVQRRGGYFEFLTQYVVQLPIRTIDFNDPADARRHERVVSLVERMRGLQEELGAVKTPNERAMVERRIEAVDGQIDGLVYELYGLTEGEIKIVEGK
jgi:hypothetical protein